MTERNPASAQNPRDAGAESAFRLYRLVFAREARTRCEADNLTLTAMTLGGWSVQAWLRPVLPILIVTLVLVFGAHGASAQELTLDLGDDGSMAARSIQLLVLVTLLSLAPGLAIMVTCFPFIVTVLSILRQGIGLQQSPPNMLIVSLALFLTYFVMDPVLTEAWTREWSR